MSRGDKKEYALYHGDDFLAIGTVSELAAMQRVSETTIRWYGSSAAAARENGYHLVETGTFKPEMMASGDSDGRI